MTEWDKLEGEVDHVMGVPYEVGSLIGRPATTASSRATERLKELADEALEANAEKICVDPADLKALTNALSALRARVAELANDLALKQIECDGVGSMLLSVQQDCINEHKKVEQLEKELEACREDQELCQRIALAFAKRG